MFELIYTESESAIFQEAKTKLAELKTELGLSEEKTRQCTKLLDIFMNKNAQVNWNTEALK